MALARPIFLVVVSRDTTGGKPVPARSTDSMPTRNWLASVWDGVLDLSLVLWVARGPFALLTIGFLLLGFAPQAQDLLIPLVNSRYYSIALFFPLVFVLWSIPTHYAARLALDDDERLEQYRQRRHPAWLHAPLRHGPRVMGALTFIAFLVCAYRGRAAFPVVIGEDENFRKEAFAELAWFMFWCGVWFVIALVYGALHERRFADSAIMRRLDRAVAPHAAPVLDRLDVASHRSTGRTRGKAYFARTLLLAYFVAFVAVMLLDPFLVADWLPRAWCVALVLGGWLPWLAYLSIIGRRLRAPLIIGSFAALSIVVTIIGDNHDVRLRAAEKGADARIPLDQALADWAKANGCAAAIAECPRPV